MSAAGLTGLFSFALASLLIELTPGPNMTWLAVISVTKGCRAGLASVAGVASGLALIGLAAAFGVAELVRASPAVYEILRWAGVAFMLYLAADGWRGGDEAEAGDGDGKFFLRGFITNVLNPKAALFYITLLPAFLDPAGDVLAGTLLLTAIYVGVATGVHAVIVLGGAQLAPLLAKGTRQTIVRKALSALLALVALWLAWSTAR